MSDQQTNRVVRKVSQAPILAVVIKGERRRPGIAEHTRPVMCQNSSVPLITCAPRAVSRGGSSLPLGRNLADFTHYAIHSLRDGLRRSDRRLGKALYSIFISATSRLTDSVHSGLWVSCSTNSSTVSRLSTTRLRKRSLTISFLDASIGSRTKWSCLLKREI